jgi:hypothetical protein
MPLSLSGYPVMRLGSRNSMQKTFAAHASKVSIQPYALSDVEGDAFLSGTSLYGTVVSDIASGNIPIKITTID